MREGNIDLKTSAVMTGEQPRVDECNTPDTVYSTSESPSLVTIDVDMGCRGMLVVSDNWFPGWIAALDQKPARIWKIDTAFRGVVVPAGRHRVVMNYRPASVYAGLACWSAGLIFAAFLVRRKLVRPEEDEASA